jgi:glycosyltransferase involved in cell wall biosynthesis
MKISYAIPVKDELHQLQHLITHLSDNKKFDDEIVILYDSENGHEYVEEYLRSHSVNSEYRWYERKLNDNFAEQKNYLNKLCKGDWIFQIDCDEYPDEELLENIHSIIEANGSDLELLYVPRINTVKGITREHIDKWNWPISKMETLIDEKEIDTDSEEYKLLKNLGFIISETPV